MNNAGIDPAAHFLDVNEEMWEAVVGTNLRGTFFCAQAAPARASVQFRGDTMPPALLYGTGLFFAHYRITSELGEGGMPS